jgi:hypothetical protein
MRSWWRSKPVDDVPAPLRVLTGMAAIASALAADPVCPN